MNRTPLIPFLTILFCSLRIDAQSQQDLVGTWDVNYEATIDLMNSSIRAKYDTLGASTIAIIQSQLVSQQYFFSSDGSFEARVQSESQSGSWTLESNQLIIDFGGGGVVKQTIESVTQQILVLRVVDDPSSDALIHRISLTKSTN